MKKLTITGLLFLLLTPMAFARDLSKVAGWEQLFNDTLKAVSWLFWVVAIVMIFYAAYLFVTGGDNEDQISKAKQQLLYAVIGIAVALLASVIPSLIENILGIGNTAPTSNSSSNSTPSSPSQPTAGLQEGGGASYTPPAATAPANSQPYTPRNIKGAQDIIGR